MTGACPIIRALGLSLVDSREVEFVSSSPGSPIYVDHKAATNLASEKLIGGFDGATQANVS